MGIRANRAVICLLAGLMIASLAAGCKKPASGPEELEPLLIGCALETSGPFALYGEAAERGIRFAVERVNAAGGVSGRMLEVVVEDTAALPAQAVSVAERLIGEKKVDLLVGTVHSSTTLAILPVIEKWGIPLVSHCATAPGITAPDAPGKSYRFRLMPTNDILGPALGRYAVTELGLKRIAIVTDMANEWNVTWERAFTSHLERVAVKPAAVEAIKTGDTDFYALLAKIKAVAPDGLFLNASMAEAVPLCAQLQEVGLKVQVIGTQGLSHPAFVSAAGLTAEGLVALSLYEPSNLANPVSVEFTAAYQQRYGTEPGLYEAQGYDGIMLIADALGRAGGDKSKLLAALKETRNFQGVISPYQFDQNGQAIGGSVLLVKITQGRKELVAVIGTQ